MNIGDVYPFQWRDINDNYVDILISRDGGAYVLIAESVANIINVETEDWNTYEWPVTGPTAAAAKLKAVGHTNTDDFAEGAEFVVSGDVPVEVAGVSTIGVYVGAGL